MPRGFQATCVPSWKRGAGRTCRFTWVPTGRSWDTTTTPPFGTAQMVLGTRVTGVLQGWLLQFVLFDATVTLLDLTLAVERLSAWIDRLRWPWLR